MPDLIPVPVANPSPFARDDYVEVDVRRLGVPDAVPDSHIRLFRRSGEELVELPVQVDRPFGEQERDRVLTFFCQGIPPGPEDYSRPSATFFLDFRSGAGPGPAESPVWVEHYFSESEISRGRELDRAAVRGVKLGNTRPDSVGLEVYFSLVPRPRPDSPLNYTGAATSVMHQRAARERGHGEMLSPLWFPHQERKRWGQLTRLDFYPLPWEPRRYHVEPLLAADGEERRYHLVWSNQGPHRATVTLQSEPFELWYQGAPVFNAEEVRLTCRLYRIISLFPWREFYTEQLVVRPTGRPGLSLAFRAHYESYVDLNAPPPEVARQESIPDYFAVWRRWMNARSPLTWNLGFGFASDSHVRALVVDGPLVRWRLQVGHEHRCVHTFMYEPHQGFDLAHTVGHDAWYLRLFKPLEVLPFTRYLKP